MSQFYIVEIKQNQADEYEHEVFWAWDDDPEMAQFKAEAKYHEILSRAAVSTNKVHAAIIFSTEGFPIVHQCYKHSPPEPAE